MEPPDSPRRHTAEYVKEHSDICLEGFTSILDPLDCRKAACQQCKKALNAETDDDSSHSAREANVKVQFPTQQRERLNSPKLYPFNSFQMSTETQGVLDITKYLTKRNVKYRTLAV